MKNIIMSLLLGLVGFKVGFAHEGHDHDAPSKAKAQKGGVMRSFEKLDLEVVSKGQELKIYLWNKDGTPRSTQGFSLTANAQKPKAKVSDEVKLEAKESHFEGVYDAGKVHRYKLTLNVKDPLTGHDDKVNINIEPKK